MFVMAEIQDHAIRAGEAVDDPSPLAKDSTNDCSFCDNMDMNIDGDGSSNNDSITNGNNDHDNKHWYL